MFVLGIYVVRPTFPFTGPLISTVKERSHSCDYSECNIHVNSSGPRLPTSTLEDFFEAPTAISETGQLSGGFGWFNRNNNNCFFFEICLI